VIEIRHEAPDAPAARALFAAYMADVDARLGEFTPTEQIFATPDAFDGPGGAWLVVYEDGEAVACAGLRPLGDGAGEIKRMFVAEHARGRGHARRLLAELEGIARDAGIGRIRLLTTEVLTEARALYAAEGYEVVEAFPMTEPDRTDYWLEKALGQDH
jgi:GNAT superfamily N-acetyltransferase